MKTLRLTVEQARELFNYDPETGVLKWTIRKGKKIPLSMEAGYVDDEGYRVVRVDGVNYRAHRMIWLIKFGEWPDQMIDHVNGERADNRISNLRLATNAQNQMNKRARSSSATKRKGVTRQIKKNGRVRYRASVYDGKQYVVLGYFDTPEEAHSVYWEAAQKIFGEFARPE